MPSKLENKGIFGPSRDSNGGNLGFFQWKNTFFRFSVCSVNSSCLKLHFRTPNLLIWVYLHLNYGQYRKIGIFEGGHFENGHFDHFCNGKLPGDIFLSERAQKIHLEKCVWGGCRGTYYTCPTIVLMEKKYFATYFQNKALHWRQPKMKMQSEIAVLAKIVAK